MKTIPLDIPGHACAHARMARARAHSRPTLTEALQAAVEASAESLYAISMETGIAQSILSRFMSNTTRLRLDHASTLAAYLGLELRQVRKMKS